MAYKYCGIADEATKLRATERLYLLLPNHKCPQKDCPFHPPEDVGLESEALDVLKNVCMDEERSFVYDEIHSCRQTSANIVADVKTVEFKTQIIKEHLIQDSLSSDITVDCEFCRDENIHDLRMPSLSSEIDEDMYVNINVTLNIC